MTVSSRSLGDIWSIVWGDRGGGPLHFFLEHFVMQWPGGLVGLRVPSLVFLVAALPAAALVARELAGDVAAAASVLLLGLAPLALSHGTFGRPHTMLTAWFLWGLWAALRGATTASRLWWAVGAIVLASSVFVHPIAPVYAGAGAVAALAYAPRPPRAVAREAWPGAFAFALVLVPYWVHSLHVLRNRYEVGGGRRGRTYSGQSVLHDAVLGLSPGTHVVNLFTVAAVAGVVALVRRGRLRAAAVPLVVVVVPIVFFSLVPSTGRSAIFFSRYMLPALPLFLTLVAAGVVAVAALLPRASWAVAIAVLVILGGLELSSNLDRMGDVRSLRLNALTSAVRGTDAVLFGSVGTIAPGRLDRQSYGRPPTLVDRYLLLRIGGLDRVDDHSCVPAVRFLRAGGPPRRGLWIFYGASDEEVDAGRRALPGARRVGRYLLVESRPLGPRALLAEGERLRLAWMKAVPADFKVDYHVRADRTALRAPDTCQPLGEFGDPDITPRRDIPRPTD